MLNLLSWLKIDLGEGAFYAVFGFLFVFMGIVVLILIFTLLGLIMKKVNAKKKKDKNAKKSGQTVEVQEAEPAVEAGISPEVIAVIAAAVSAYVEEGGGKCDFVVKRIKKL